MGGDFYTTAAQVIPLFFVAIAFEGRAVWKPALWERWAISPNAMSGIRLIHTAGMTFALVSGETAALWALGHNAPVSFEAGRPGWVIVGCLSIGGMALITQVSAHFAVESMGPSKVFPLKPPAQLGSIVFALTVAIAALPAFMIVKGFSG